MFDQPSSGLHQPLLQTAQRPVLDSLGQRQSPPQIPQIVGQALARSYGGLGQLQKGKVVLVVWNIVTCVRATPDFIPYFNELAAPYGSRILVDSDFDWGQDLKRLSSVLQQQQIDSIWISYEGSANLKQHGLPYLHLLLPQQKPSGWIAISEFEIKERPADFRWLEKYKPERIVAKTIRLYHFDTAPADN